MKSITELHAEIVARLNDLAEVMDAVIVAADAAAAVAEDDPTMDDYVTGLSALMSLTIPPLPPAPNA